MHSVNLIESFSEFKDVKNIDRVTLMSIIEEVFRSMLTKKFGTDKNFDIIVNPDKGDVEMYKNRTVVDDDFAEDSFDYDANKHISLTEAKKIDSDFVFRVVQGVSLCHQSHGALARAVGCRRPT